MKVGPYCGYSLDEIIKIKQEEERQVGKFFWGYGGVFCRPHTIQSFVSFAKTSPIVLFTETKSKFNPEESNRFYSFSSDNSAWNPLDKNVLLVGNNGVPHFAITAKNLRETKMDINLNDYISFTSMGMFPNTYQYLDDYFRYRVDKVCAVYSPARDNNTKKMIRISYRADLVEPYSVFIK